MKRKAASITVLVLMVVMITTAAPRVAGAEAVTGKEYSVFIYSKYMSEPAATITFKDDGVLLMSTYSGIGWYFAFTNGVVAVFSAPEVEENKDIFMVMTGLVLLDFMGGAGITVVNGEFSEVFLFTGYVAAS